MENYKDCNLYKKDEDINVCAHLMECLGCYIQPGKDCKYVKDYSNVKDTRVSKIR